MGIRKETNPLLFRSFGSKIDDLKEQARANWIGGS